MADAYRPVPAVWDDVLRGPEVSVLEEPSIPIDLMLNDSTVQAVTAILGMSPDALRALARSVVSMKLQATKPTPAM